MPDRYDSVDLLKFILSLLVVAIHFDPLGIENFRAPLLLLPVPMFFIISSFFFFRKNVNISKLCKFIKRNLVLYGAYFCLFLPYNVLIWRNTLFSEGGIVQGFLRLLLKFLLGSTFRSSWYIIALVLSVTIVFFLHSKTYLCWLLGISFYVICMFSTCYGDVPVLGDFFGRVTALYPGTFYQSVPIAIIWVLIGKSLAEHENECLKLSKRKKYFFLIGSSILLMVEYIMIRFFNWESIPGYCFMMVPMCVSIFIFVLGLNMKLAYSIVFREASTVIYCAHATIGDIISALCSKMDVFLKVFPLSFALYFTIILCCLLGLFIIRRLGCNNRFKWCRYFL